MTFESFVFDADGQQHRDVVFDHSAAFAAWGPIVVELAQVHAIDDRLAAAYRIAPGAVSHVSWVVPDLALESARLAQLGCRPINTARTGPISVAWHEGGPLFPHPIEVHQHNDVIASMHRQLCALRADGDVYLLAMAVNAPPGWMVPSAGLWRMRLTQVATAGPVLAVIAGVAAGIWTGAWAGAAASAVVAVAAGFVLWVERRRYLAWAYREREEDLIVSRGVLVRRVSVVPYGRMQFVEVTAGPFERVFRLATVQLHTAAAASDARIPGLERDEAARLRDRLAMLGEARAAGL